MQHGKLCPEPLIRDIDAWNLIKEAILMNEAELSLKDKCKKVQDVAVLDDNTGLYFQFYKYNTPLIDKLYKMAVDAEKWRKLQKNDL
jgi:hypothetical protein